MQPRVVIIGAGIVGTALADEITRLGWTDVTVLDRGPLFRTGGSTSHAPGLVFQTNPSKTMAELARYTVEKFGALEAFDTVGGLEVATTPERWTDLHRRHGWAQAWGIEARLLDAGECARLHPLLDPDRVLGGFHTPTDGLALAVRAAERQAAAAADRGGRFIGYCEVVEVISSSGRVTGVRARDGQELPADIVVSAAGFWGAQLGRGVGLTVPLVPMAHQFAKTGPVPALAGDERLPILRHQDADLYYRTYGDRIGIGYYGHRPRPVEMDTLLTDTAGEPMPSMLPFTAAEFEPAWAETLGLLPALGETKVDEAFDGIFSFTPDGFPILGEHRDLAGFWVAEAVWVTHSAGVAREVARWIVEGAPGIDLHEADLYRFEEAARSPEFIRSTSVQAFVEVYDIIHPHQYRNSPRNIRTGPFHARQRELGAFCYEGGLWERPAWYEANAGLMAEVAAQGVAFPARDDWSARFYSPISIAEAAWTRTHVAMYDMTPLTRYEVTGTGATAFLQELTTNDVGKKPGAVTYTLLLDGAGGVRSDLTVARLGECHFQVGANGPLDFDWLTRRLPGDGSVVLRDITGGTCCVGVWGPDARDMVQPLCPEDLSHKAFGYFKAKSAYLGSIPVTMLRVSYVGELGWEIYTSAEHGAALWDLLWEAGRPQRVIAAGRIAFNSLRLEKGYRSWGTDMTTEHTPDAAGLGFAVRMSKPDFLGKRALEAAPPPRQLLRTLVLDDPAAVVLGKEPVFIDGAVAGYTTSAGYSATVGRTLAYAWLPATAQPGDEVEIAYLTERFTARVHADPVVDPEMARIRR
ncbi:FAD-dependent oxidoreductase [Nocardia sp. ET3-3]|uniref:FAD-dependent oxidoreductase n=1 Tax=Nocardia terrae TaxID=2675851 RepID=A0A7K1V9M4_9NOCA|nr:FAD-dependent oxidoreductase [Nocardia terrae]MVU83330.1 FAD-dependent oxidoreductase [Nocardia terrae]